LREFDFGPAKNKELYGSEMPPEVDMTKIKDSGVPVAMYVAKHDRIIYPVDSRWARDVLGSSVVDYREIDGGHVTFMVGKD
jgi:hypothetical protein